MLDPRLKRVRDLLYEVDPADKERRAAVWSREYRRMLEYTLHGMHKIAWENDLGGLTAGDWFDDPGLADYDHGIDPEGEQIPALGVSSTKFYRGYAVHVSIRGEGSSWGYFASAEGDRGSVIFETREDGFDTLEAAYHSGVISAVRAIDGLAD